MAGSRTYRRNRNGQFASKGTVVTTGRAGGFANASHRANVANKRAAKAHRNALVRKGVKIAATGAAGAAVGAVARRGVKKSNTGQTLGDVAGTIRKAVTGGN
jgi:glutamate synthase domain-containing protein 3